MNEPCNQTTDEVYWVGEIPIRCAICRGEIAGTFVDGYINGEWRFSHACCHKVFGSFGPNNGQCYQQQPNGRWLMVGVET